MVSCPTCTKNLEWYLNYVEYSTYLIMVNPVHDIVVNAVRNMADMVISQN